MMIDEVVIACESAHAGTLPVEILFDLPAWEV